MTDEEYIKKISSVSTKELFNLLEYYGYESYFADLWRATIEELKKRIEERPQGEWKKIGEEYYNCNNHTVIKCSHCGYVKNIPGEITPHFCEECGADMEVRNDNKV